MLDPNKRQTAYEGVVRALLPRGIAFRSPNGPNLKAVLDAMAAALVDGHVRVESLIDEANPRTTGELLIDWENAAGLPDACQGPLDSVALRRAALVDRLGWSLSPTVDGIEAVALLYDSLIEIEEQTYLKVGARVGDRCGNVPEGWPWTFVVHLPSVAATFFRAGQSSVGEPLATWGSLTVMCVIDRVKPAHTRACFIADGQQHPIEYQPWGVRVYPDTKDLPVTIYKPQVL